MFSGGLDSCLAAKIVHLRGIEVIALYINTPFFALRREPGKFNDNLRRRAEKAGAKLAVFTPGSEYLDLIRSPKYGYGSNMNPCIDCKIFFYQKAYEVMKSAEAQFIITGEVMGQRPMTQLKPTLILLERRAGLSGLVLRPLSAKLLPPTVPEEKGWIEREVLYDIHGRGRRRQLALAKELEITDFASPAGGCLLTDPGFSRRLKDLFAQDTWEMNDIILLKTGRHFRLSPTAKLIVGRNQIENRFISEIAQSGDILLEVIGYGSPLCLLRGAGADEFIKLAGEICKRYSDARQLAEVDVCCWRVDDRPPFFIKIAENIGEERLKELIIH